MRRWGMRAAVVLAAAGLAVACGGPGSSRSEGPVLREVALPNLSGLDDVVREQVEQRYREMQSAIDRGAPPAERAQAYGRFGMVLHAGEYYDAAEPAYRNAQALAPREHRWPYYLAQLYQSIGDADASMASFRRVLELRPDDVPTLVYLGRAHLARGEADLAEPYFERAYAAAPRSVAVLAGLGQAALARGDHETAVTHLEAALAIDPQSDSLHSPLAQAYRRLGDAARAEMHAAQWRNTDVLVPDPLGQELDMSLDSGLSYELRGVRALEQQDFPLAASLFRQGVELTTTGSSLGRSLRHKLGTALYMTGDVAGAVHWFEEALTDAPSGEPDEAIAKAQYSLGVLMASAGRGDDAIGYLSDAVRSSPTYIEAFLALGDALRRAGRVEESLDAYEAALEIDPFAGAARFGYGIALVRLGRHREARDWFEEATRLMPDAADLTPEERGARRQFPHALARLLAASPDDAVRDGPRAKALVDGLLASVRTTDLGETMAMAYAEMGDYAQAVATQEAVMAATRSAGAESDLDRLAVNLALYRQGRPSRTPWPDDDPVHDPGPPVDPSLRAVLVTAAP